VRCLQLVVALYKGLMLRGARVAELQVKQQGERQQDTSSQ